jgi:hypothetical protein
MMDMSGGGGCLLLLTGSSPKEGTWMALWTARNFRGEKRIEKKRARLKILLIRPPNSIFGQQPT